MDYSPVKNKVQPPEMLRNTSLMFAKAIKVKVKIQQWWWTNKLPLSIHLDLQLMYKWLTAESLILVGILHMYRLRTGRATGHFLNMCWLDSLHIYATSGPGEIKNIYDDNL